MIPVSTGLLRNFTTFGRLVNGILRKSIAGGFKESSLLTSVFVDPQPFDKWLATERFRETRRALSIEEVTEALGCPEEDLRNLVQEEKLRWAERTAWRHSVDGPSVFEFTEMVEVPYKAF